MVTNLHEWLGYRDCFNVGIPSVTCCISGAITTITGNDYCFTVILNTNSDITPNTTLFIVNFDRERKLVPKIACMEMSDITIATTTNYVIIRSADNFNKNITYVFKFITM